MRIRSAVWALALVVSACPLISSEKVSVAVVDFDAKNINRENAEAVTDLLRTELFNTGHFIVIERERIQKILEEQKFQSSGLTNADQAAEIGRLLNVKKIMLGSVTLLGSTYIINTRIVDVQSGQVVLAEAVECHGGEDMLPGSITELALKIAYKVGVEGSIIRISSKELFVDLGSADGIKVGQVFDVYRIGETITDLEGHAIGSNTEKIGSIMITKVQERFSEAAPQIQTVLFYKGDKVRPQVEAGSNPEPEEDQKKMEKAPEPKEKKPRNEKKPEMPAVF
jgi:TolB-like protein